MLHSLSLGVILAPCRRKFNKKATRKESLLVRKDGVKAIKNPAWQNACGEARKFSYLEIPNNCQDLVCKEFLHTAANPTRKHSLRVQNALYYTHVIHNHRNRRHSAPLITKGRQGV